MTESEAQMISNDVFLHSSTELQDDVATSEKTTPIPTMSPPPSYAPLTIRIDYILENPRYGVMFVEKDDDVAPYRSNHIYTVNQPLPGATRLWLPCIDRISERCTWDMEFIVPRKMGATMVEYDAEGPLDDEDATVVVCSGEVMEQILHPTDASKKIVHYSLSVPTSAPFIAFAIGPFEMIKLSPSQLQEEVLSATDLDENQQQSLMAEINMMSNIYAFALPGMEEDLSAMHFYAQEYGSYPFSDFKLVFVEDAWNDSTASASLAICSSALLHPPEIIDQTYSTRRILSLALAKQWFGIHIIQKSWPDTWLVCGLAHLMASLFIKRHLGNNEYRLRLKRDMELCCSLDINRAPLYNPALPSPLDPEDLEFLELKAPLVLYMLDKRMCKGGATLGLSRVLPKILVSAMSGELVQNTISTHYFMKLCRKISGFDTKTFAEQWVYKSGCPKFGFWFHFNRKKMVVEIYMHQENTNKIIGTGEGASSMMADGSAINFQELTTPLFTGNLTVRIHEADGTPYEHILDIQSANHKYEVQFNTKYKRIRRNTKRFLAKQAAAAAAVAEEEQENEEGEGGTTNVLGIIPSLGLGMPMFEEQPQRQEWKIVEWGQDEEDTSGAASAMFDWIRLDAEFEWLTAIEFKQPDYMWAAQLTKDRDVVAQHEAIGALRQMASPPTSTSLLRALMDPKCFYKIRMEAAYALATCAVPTMDYVGLHQLNKMFQKRYCFPINSSQMDLDDEIPVNVGIPKPNNFSNLPDYFIQKAVVIAFSQVRDQHGLTPIKIRQFLLDLLKYNDNIGNEFSDCYYVATLISALGDALIPAPDSPDALRFDDLEGEELLMAAKSEIERFRTLDYVIPSYHNVVTAACLKTATKLMLNNLMDVDLALFMQYTRYGNFVDIRLAAFDSLFVLCGLTDNALTRYFLKIIQHDPCIFVSHYVARSTLAWLGLAMKEKTDLSQSRFVEEFAEEEGKVIIDDDRQPFGKTPQQEFQASVENLRKRFENNSELQQNIWDILNLPEHSTLDHCIRKYLLQFCEYMYKPIDVGLKVTIRVPSLPTPEVVEEPELHTPTLPKQPLQSTQPPQPVQAVESTQPTKPTKPTKSTKPTKPAQPAQPAQPTQPTQPKKPMQPTQPAQPVQSTQPILRISKPKPTAATTDGEGENEVSKVEKKAHAPAVSIKVEPAAEPRSPAAPPVVVQKAPVRPPVPKQKTATATPVMEKPAETIPPKPAPKQTKGMPAEDTKKARRLLTKLQKHRAAQSFLQPVDEVLDGAPDYFKIIKRPMDLGTVKRKLENRQYESFRRFEDDIRLMLSNCFAYNGPGTFVYNEGQTLEAVFEKELALLKGKEIEESQNLTIVESPAPQPRPTSEPALVPPKPTAAHKSSSSQPNTPATAAAPVKAQPEKKVEKEKSDKDKLVVILTKTMESPHAFEFLRPVDPIKQGIPHYRNIIRHPMDLGTIKSKLRANRYVNPQQFDSDVRLMFRNCYTFNPPNFYIHNEAKKLEELYNNEWSAYFGHLRRSAVDASQEVSAQDAQAPATKPSKATHPVQPRTKPIQNEGLPVTAPSPSKPSPTHEPQHELVKTSTVVSANARPSAAMQPQMDDNNKRRCERILRKLWQHQASQPFYEPVDAAALNIPQYYEIIKKPMDLSTVRRNLDENRYTTIWEFEKDIRQIFWNCYRFNDASSWVAQQGQALESFANQIWSTEFGDPDALKGDDKRLAQKVVGKLMAHEAAALFNEPVDCDMFTDYRQIIKSPMDLRTINEKLESGKYISLSQVDGDIRLVFSNCFTYNNSVTYAYEQGKRLEKYYQNIGKELRSKAKAASPVRPKQPTGTPATAGLAKPAAMTNTSSKTVNSTSSAKPESSKKPKEKKAPVIDEPTPMDISTPPKLHPAVKTALESLLNKLMDHKASLGFLEPVDPVGLNIPHYPLIIKKPMDLGTISKNLKAGEYKTLKDFESDVLLVFTNCYTFNGIEHPISRNAKILEGIFNKEMPGIRAKEEQLKSVSTPSPSASNGTKPAKAPTKSLKSASPNAAKAELRKYKAVLDKLQLHPSFFPFGAPVDPVLLQIPTYFDIIKKPMDFGTIRKKLEGSKYTEVDQLLRDANQVFVNCYTFNLEDDIVYKMGQEIEAEFNKLCAAKGLKTTDAIRSRQNDNKREAESTAEGQEPTKKTKFN
ncbi:hypothetical protein EC973_007483 [Apophysomyces ossiformis]|uniref:Transcription initiation factor TFIID subunit 2 n=1 Tax=Apophysomyces ossiformis TaxID=679940 RepID=A0A8H7BP87_9FUNG|nr:hypothetical protein EC973_007483 [Apophysomyces ossiformis]